MSPRRLAEQREPCHACGQDRLWLPARGGRFVRCEGCGDRFPCRSLRCGHLDCDETRAWLAEKNDRVSE